MPPPATGKFESPMRPPESPGKSACSFTMRDGHKKAPKAHRPPALARLAEPRDRGGFRRGPEMIEGRTSGGVVRPMAGGSARLSKLRPPRRRGTEGRWPPGNRPQPGQRHWRASLRRAAKTKRGPKDTRNRNLSNRTPICPLRWSGIPTCPPGPHRSRRGIRRSRAWPCTMLR